MKFFIGLIFLILTIVLAFNNGPLWLLMILAVAVSALLTPPWGFWRRKE